MIFDWLRDRRRRELQTEEFPESWDAIMAANVYHVRSLNEQQKTRLRRLVQVFVSEKNWEACGGLETVTEDMKVTIAAQASLLVIGLDEEIYFDHVLSILVYPHAYIAPNTRIGRAGLILQEGQVRQGEAWYRGPVILSWEDTLAGGRLESPGHNLVLHEFAHQLDMMNGRVVDGTPLLESDQQLARWARVMEPEYLQLVETCKKGQRGFIDCYGATNEAEFFAVLTETFFERPQPLRSHHPDVYELLRDYFHVDPAEWLNA